MKRNLTCIILAIILIIGSAVFTGCEEKPVPTQLGDIADVTKGYFGDKTPDITYALSDYIQTNGAEVTYEVSSSDESVATAALSGDTLTVKLLKGEGSTTVTVKVINGEEEAFAIDFAVNAAEYKKIACVGDSLTAGHSWPKESYPVYLGEELGADYEVGNFGFNGASICGYNPNIFKKYVDQTVYPASLEMDADIVVIMLGTNDSKDWPKSEPEFAGLYTDLVNSYKENNPDVKILMVTAPPTMADNKFNIPNDVIRDNVVPAQRKLAEELGLPMLDLRQIMEEMDGGYEAMIRQDAAFDGVHFSVEGAKYLAKLVAEAIYEF
nr:hypothetical protein [Clostridia bacterium]